MGSLFATVFNMSLTASIVIAAVLLARFVLSRTHAPKWISYALWAVVLFRLLCPVAIESSISLLPFSPQLTPKTAPIDNVSPSTAFGAGLKAIGDALNGGLGTVTMYLNEPSVNGSIPVTKAFHPQVWLTILRCLWAFGVIAMLIYAVISYVLFKRRLRFSTKKDGNVYETDRIRSPFVLGFVHPRIYLPVGLRDSDLGYILRHERTHIKRCDYLVKPVAFFALALHWFNPLVWLAYFLLNKDMEMSCDERVLTELGGEAKAVYSNALLALATGKRLVGLSPLAFGEGDTKGRIKNVLNFKKPSRIIVVVAIVLVAALTVGFAVNKATSTPFANFTAIVIDEHIYDMNSTEPLHLDLYDNGIGVLNVFLAQGKKGHNSINEWVKDVRSIEQVEIVLGKGETGWKDREQRLRYERYTNSIGITATFTYTDGVDGVLHRLVWVDVESDSANPNNGFDADKLSALRTPYVGDNSAIGKIINALPPLEAGYTQKFFSIGDDYGTDFAPNTLTVYYERDGADYESTIEPINAILLFALIDNLEEVSYALRATPSGDELDKSEYTTRVTYSKSDMTEYIAVAGLDWDDFHNDLTGSMEKVSSVTASPPDSQNSIYVTGVNVENYNVADDILNKDLAVDKPQREEKLSQYNSRFNK